MTHRTSSIRLATLAAALAAVLGTTAPARAQTEVCLVAMPFTASGAAAGVPMWGYAPATWNGSECVASGPATSPGPRITLSATDQALTIRLTNALPVPTSLIIPGLPSPGDPARAGTRARSFTTEVLPNATGVYSWPAIRPGTFMYQSGSHVQVQIQMGLFGAMTKSAAALEAYPGKAYASEVLLFYSEIDPNLHRVVAEGKYGGVLPIPATPGVVPNAGTPNMTSTLDYEPRYFLVNGDAYPGAATTVAAGGAGATTLIRFLNAGLRTHVPTLVNGDFELVAEDAHPYPYPRRQVQMSLPAGKTTDVLWTPASPGIYPVFDRTPHLTTDGTGPGGMIARLEVGGTLNISADVYHARYDAPLVVGPPGVMANDGVAGGATLDAAPACMPGFVLNADGSFTYVFSAVACPAPYPTSDVFTYHQAGTTPVTVTVNLAANAEPAATAAFVTVQEDSAATITLRGSDPNADPLTFTLGTLPSNGSLTGTAPNLVYTPSANYVGPDSFTFTVSDGTSTSTPAVIDITVAPVNDAPAATPASVSTSEDAPVAITLAGTDVDPGDVLTFRVTTNPTNGTLSGFDAATGQVVYSPRADFFGPDSFRFVVNDGQVDSVVATVTIAVSAVADAPTALDDTYKTRYNASLTMDVLKNDKDPDGTPLTIVGTFPKCFNSSGVEVTPCTATTTGVDKVTINSSLNRLTLVPNSASRPPGNPGYRLFTFTYQAKDASNALSAAARVTATVQR